ncbi:MAG: hypothetical protein KDC54_18990, partial [Lewinella sp.]|nr:hypothetical protein [Lewinella sp.]
MNDRAKTVWRWMVINPLVIVLGLELALRLLGYQAFRNTDYAIQATPPNAFVGHPDLGIELNPGAYRIQVNHGLTFTAHHLDDHSRRVTGRKAGPADVLLLGCS